MPRARAILQSEFPYNVSARCINREWFQVPMEEVWQIFCEELAKTSAEHKLLIHSFVLMSNHFHLIVSTPEANISQCMAHFMKNSSRRLTRAGNRINETFAGRHYKGILQEYNYFLNAYKYNYRNPVMAGLCKRVEDYPFSTLQMVTGSQKMKLPIVEDAAFLSDPKGTLNWLNTDPDPSKLEAARLAFRRPYFRTKKCRITNDFVLSANETL